MPVALALTVLLFSRQVKPDAKVLGLLSKMRSAYSSVKSAGITMTTTRFARGGTKLVMSSEALFKSPNSFRISTTGVPGLTKPAYLLVTDGKQIHVEGLPGKPFTVPYSVAELERNLPQLNLEVLCFWDWKIQLSADKGGNMHFSTFTMRTETWLGKKWTVLQETAAQQNEVIDYYIDPSTLLMHRTACYFIKSHTLFLDCAISNLKINEPVDANTFAIAPTK